ncbi:MAG: hypothetical protein HGA45_29645 [Chloroflexales bacterium]|nr:hypothetical protein [Chloroflexales bacterium]
MADGTETSSRPNLDGAGPYTIKVYGQVARHWELELRMRLTYTQTERGTISTLAGELPDQAALLGALGRLAMWGYLIILVRYDISFDERKGEPDTALPL